MTPPIASVQRDGDVAVAGGRLWAWSAGGYAVVVALGLAYFVAGIPLQINDCLGNLLHVQYAGPWGTFVEDLTAQDFLRPLLLAQSAVAFELADGRYLAMYKAIHALQLVAAALLFVNVLQVRSWSTACAAMFGVAVLFGGHTFAGTVTEGFPINTFLTIVVCCLAAANLSFGRPAAWRDVAAVVLFAGAALTVESGLLVWVVLASAWVAGARGVSNRGMFGVSAALAGYFVLRFAALDIGVPSLELRSSGFGFRVLDPQELIARFGDRPGIYYAYNVVCQVLTVLFAEPKGGVWAFARGLSSGELLPRDVNAVVAATGSTALIAWHAGTRLGDWRRGRIEHGDRLLLVAAAVLVANAAIGFAYTKDVIVSPAGAFHAAAASVAFAHVIARIHGVRSMRMSGAGLAMSLALLSGLWVVRLVGIHYYLHEKAFVVRNDWMWLGPEPAGFGLERNPAGAKLVRDLYDQAVRMPVAGTFFYPSPRHAWKYFEKPW